MVQSIPSSSEASQIPDGPKGGGQLGSKAMEVPPTCGEPADFYPKAILLHATHAAGNQICFHFVDHVVFISDRNYYPDLEVMGQEGDHAIYYTAFGGEARRPSVQINSLYIFLQKQKAIWPYISNNVNS